MSWSEPSAPSSSNTAAAICRGPTSSSFGRHSRPTISIPSGHGAAGPSSSWSHPGRGGGIQLPLSSRVHPAGQGKRQSPASGSLSSGQAISSVSTSVVSSTTESATGAPHHSSVRLRHPVIVPSTRTIPSPHTNRLTEGSRPILPSLLHESSIPIPHVSCCFFLW